MSSLRWRSCSSKRAYSRATAMSVAARLRDQGETVGAYRCVFDGTHWHIGHCPTLRTMEGQARMIRERRARLGVSA